MKRFYITFSVIIILLWSISTLPCGSAFARSLAPSGVNYQTAVKNGEQGIYFYSNNLYQITSVYLPVDNGILSCDRFLIYFGVDEFNSYRTVDVNHDIKIDLGIVDSKGNDYRFSPRSESSRFDADSNKLLFSNGGKYPTNYCGYISFSPHSFYCDGKPLAKDTEISFVRISFDSVGLPEQRLFVGNLCYQTAGRQYIACNTYAVAKAELDKYTTTAANKTSAARTSTTRARATRNSGDRSTAYSHTKSTKSEKSTKSHTTKATAASRHTDATNKSSDYDLNVSEEATESTAILSGQNEAHTISNSSKGGSGGSFTTLAVITIAIAGTLIFSVVSVKASRTAAKPDNTEFVTDGESADTKSEKTKEENDE